MSTQILIKKIKKLEKEINRLKQPKSVLVKMKVDNKVITEAKKALFDFDIEKFVSKKDLKAWK